MIITSVNGVNKKIKKMQHSVNGVNKKIGKIYHSVGGTNKCVFKSGYTVADISHLKAYGVGTLISNSKPTGVSISYNNESNSAKSQSFDGSIYIVFKDGVSIPFNANWSNYFSSTSVTAHIKTSFRTMIKPISFSNSSIGGSTQYEFLGYSCPVTEGWKGSWDDSCGSYIYKTKSQDLTITSSNNNSSKYHLEVSVNSGGNVQFSFYHENMTFSDSTGTTPVLEMKYEIDLSRA